MKMTTKGLALLLAATTTACATESASEFATSEINATMTAIANGDGKTRVEVNFRDASKLLTFLQLTTDDSIEATASGVTKELKESSLLGVVSYGATFDVDAAETEFRVNLTRANQDSARDSTVKMPAPFTVSQLAKQSFSRAEPITITWTSTASPDPISLGISGPCIDSYSADLGTGSTSFTVPANALVKKQNHDSTEQVPDECDLTLTLKRTRDGSIDRAFRAGTFYAQQLRTLSAHTTP